MSDELLGRLGVASIGAIAATMICLIYCICSWLFGAKKKDETKDLDKH